MRARILLKIASLLARRFTEGIVKVLSSVLVSTSCSRSCNLFLVLFVSPLSQADERIGDVINWSYRRILKMSREWPVIRQLWWNCSMFNNYSAVSARLRTTGHTFQQCGVCGLHADGIGLLSCYEWCDQTKDCPSAGGRLFDLTAFSQINAIL